MARRSCSQAIVLAVHCQIRTMPIHDTACGINQLLQPLHSTVCVCTQSTALRPPARSTHALDEHSITNAQQTPLANKLACLQLQHINLHSKPWPCRKGVPSCSASIQLSTQKLYTVRTGSTNPLHSPRLGPYYPSPPFSTGLCTTRYVLLQGSLFTTTRTQLQAHYTLPPNPHAFSKNHHPASSAKTHTNTPACRHPANVVATPQYSVCRQNQPIPAKPGRDQHTAVCSCLRLPKTQIEKGDARWHTRDQTLHLTCL